jgi:cytochrome c553
MKNRVMLATLLSLAAIFALQVGDFTSAQTTPTEGKKPQDVYKLAPDSKLGQVMFNHLDHTTKNRSADGKSQIECVECHHTAQPAAEAMKHPPHKTVWPADRTSTLTADLFTKDPDAPPVDACTECHARAGAKPKLLPEIPQIKPEGASEPITLTNQQAFHRKCGSCHDEVAKLKPDTTAPTSKKCTGCHKKSAS